MTDFNNKTVLVVDDEPDILDLVSMNLEDAGYDVITASSGNEALKVIMNQTVNAVISDIRMPDCDGLSLLNNLRIEFHDVPLLLFMTGQSDLSIEDAYDNGAKGLFQKPINFSILLETLSRALQPPSLQWSNDQRVGTTKLDVEISIPSLEKDVPCQGFSIGRGGVFIAFNEMFAANSVKIGQSIAFKVNYGDSERSVITGNGVVRWIRRSPTAELEAGCGIEFLNLSPDSIDIICKFVDVHNPKPFIPKGRV